MKRLGIGIKLEYTARNTPQQNGQVERLFATLYGKIQSMLRDANMSEKDKEIYWIEAASTATKIDNLLIRKGKKKSPYFCFYKKPTFYEKHLQTFGEKGVVTKSIRKDLKSKLENRGILCTFIGYAQDHTGDTY